MLFGKTLEELRQQKQNEVKFDEATEALPSQKQFNVNRLDD
jgi:hypothetical protein